MTGIINLPNIGTGIGLYAAYRTGKHEPAQYLGYGAAGYLAGFLATGYIGAKEAVYSGYGAYGLSCAPLPRAGTAEHEAAWLRKIGHEAGCRRGNPGYEQCVTSALMRWSPAPPVEDEPPAGDEPAWTHAFRDPTRSCPSVSAPPAGRVAGLKHERLAQIGGPLVADRTARSARRAQDVLDREKLIVAGVVGVSLLLLAMR